MKCPKCQYLGFETGDRCKNCGYDFSLIEFRSAAEDALHPSQAPAGAAPLPSWDRFDSPRDLAASQALPDPVLHPPAGEPSTEPALPLFAATAEDQPLVRLPVTPRRPLAVRRAAEQPRLRNVPKPAPATAAASEPELDFPEEAAAPALPAAPSIFVMEPPPPAPVRSSAIERRSVVAEPSPPTRRCLAAAIDYALLFGIDLAIVYFTVRMAGLDLDNWRMLPLAPLAVFLLVIAVAYVGVFTAIGGQTIGKMAARIRVVPDDAEAGGALPAVRRTAAVMLSWLTGGLGFLPALVGDHRALHDRLSRTRVVNQEPA